MDALTFIEQVVLITKNYQNAEGELKSHFEDLLEAVIQKIIQLLSQFEEVLHLSHRWATGRSKPKICLIC
jgi:hypothetical protein